MKRLGDIAIDNHTFFIYKCNETELLSLRQRIQIISFVENLSKVRADDMLELDIKLGR